MSEETPELPDPGRRALVIWYSDEGNSVELDAAAFSWLEVPELLRVALDIAEDNLPHPLYDETETNE